MGVVHLARRGDGPRVALKVLRPHIIGDAEIRARLAREVNSLRRIRSPRVAEIVDADPFGAIPYVATRYVPGLALHDHVAEEGPVEGTDLVRLADMLAEALAAVHACGVLHRDVKPANVLMEGRNPVLIDFGLARVADDPKITHTGWLLGTPGYLAPEILLGDDATTATDVHSWAATVAYAGLGRPPFGRGPGMAIMDRVRRGEHNLDGLPEGLRELIEQSLAPDPLERPTVPDLRGRLRAGVETSNPGGVPAPASASPDPFTMPMAAAARTDREAPTGRPLTHPMGDPPTRPLTEHAPAAPPLGRQSAARQAPDAQSYARQLRGLPAQEPQPARAAPPRPGARTGVPPTAVPSTAVPPPSVPRTSVPPPWGLRLRRGSLFGALGLAAGAVVAAYPVLGSFLLLMAVWLVRSGSLAVTGAGNRRLLRGRTWYDHVQTLVATPWHLVQSIPGTLMLALWSAGVGLAGALLGYAAASPAPVVMGVAGVMFAVSLGIGPGAPRVRGPLSRVIHPLARTLLGWYLAMVVLLVVAGTAGALAQAGADWRPATEAPLGLGG